MLEARRESLNDVRRSLAAQRVALACAKVQPAEEQSPFLDRIYSRMSKCRGVEAAALP
jgi:hypothetical protein